MTRCPPMISTSNPSSTSFCRSALRLMSGCDIEHLAVTDLHGLPRGDGAVGLARGAVGVCDGEAGVRATRQGQTRQRHQLVVADLVLVPGLRAAIDDDRDLVAVTVVVVAAAMTGVA